MTILLCSLAGCRHAKSQAGAVPARLLPFSEVKFEVDDQQIFRGLTQLYRHSVIALDSFQTPSPPGCERLRCG
jgi:hypothetical protein